MSERRTGRRKRIMRSLKEIYEDLDRVSSIKPDKQGSTNSELPHELLEIIISKLILRDNIRASAVCKTWLNAAISVRKANKPPLLMVFPRSGNMYEFFDPSQGNSYWLELPELHGSRVCCSKDGWLLMYNATIQLLFFFQPYTRDVIRMPYKVFNDNQPIAFSVSPTAPNCIVFTIENFCLVGAAVSTWRPGEAEWTTARYITTSPIYYFRYSIKVVFGNDCFYCFNLPSQLSIYNTITREWRVIPMLPPSLPEDRVVHEWYYGKYVVQYNGQIFLLVTSTALNPVICVLEMSPLTDKATWSNARTEEGFSVFASSLSSLGRIDLLGKMRGKVYFPKVSFYWKQCVSYSFHENRYYPIDQRYDWEERDPCNSIWVEPPESLSTFP